MTRVCLVGAEDVHLQYELLSRETARDALAAYDLREPYENTLAVETVSLGAAVALLNDLNWYLVRFVDDSFVLEPSVSETEWLSRDLATSIRNNEVDPGETDRFLRVYGVEYRDEPPVSPEEKASQSNPPEDAAIGDESKGGQSPPITEGDTDTEMDRRRLGQDAVEPPRLVEPMLVTRTDDRIPEYDLRDVDDTLVVRVTKSEFGS